MMEKKKVSILIGIYNIPSKEILETAINSILHQTYRNLEIIMIDDGSSNETFKWAEEITKNDDRVVLKKNEQNIGLAKTLNRCLELSTGYYIARMDGDDYCTLDRIEKQVDFLESNQEYQLVASNMSCFDDDGIWGSRINSEIITKKDFLFTSPIPHPTILTYKKCYEAVGGYSESSMVERNEDYDIFMRMFATGINMYVIQEELYFYREDKLCYSKRKYKYRFCEMMVRAHGYKLLKLYPKGVIYVIKPLIVGLLPSDLLKKLRMKKNSKQVKK